MGGARNLVAAFSLIWLVNCGGPTLDVSSDQAYTESLADLRGTLSSDREREFLVQMVTQLRAWREPEHEELMDVPALTPRQKQRIEELELQHKVKVRELLHGKDLDGIAMSYRRYLLAEDEEYQAWIRERIQEVETLQSVASELVVIGKMRNFGPSVLRTNQFLVSNQGERAFTDSITIKCLPPEQWECIGDGCEPFLLELSSGLESELDAGETQTLESLDIMMKADYSAATGIILKYEHWRCWTSSATIAGEFTTCCFSQPPGQEIRELQARIEESKKRSKALTSATTFAETFRLWSEQEQS